MKFERKWKRRTPPYSSCLQLIYKIYPIFILKTPFFFQTRWTFHEDNEKLWCDLAPEDIVNLGVCTFAKRFINYLYAMMIVLKIIRYHFNCDLMHFFIMEFLIPNFTLPTSFYPTVKPHSLFWNLYLQIFTENHLYLFKFYFCIVLLTTQ